MTYRILALFVSLLAASPGALRASTSRFRLDGRWEIQSSAANGRGIWLPARVSSTVVSTLVDNGVLPDPYTGMNLRAFPGMDYAIGENFSQIPMADSSPFSTTWWYRTTFRLPSGFARDRVWLHFDSINYRANIWLNGIKLADQYDVAGIFRAFELDASGAVNASGENILTVQVFPPTENALSVTFIDWHPMPPDKETGITGPVYLTSTGPVTVRRTQAVSKVSAALDMAQVTLAADFTNTSDQPIDGVATGIIGEISVSRAVRLAPRESARLTFTPEEYPQLAIRNPDLWWPYELGPQNLHRLRMEFQAGGAVTDAEETQFGIREFSSGLDDQGHRVFSVNGKRLLIRGGGWTRDLLLRSDDERELSELRYVRDMGLNALRLEGQMMSDHFLETADQLGLLVMPGWACCSYWEQWDEWGEQDSEIAVESLRNQVRRLRNHASVLAFVYGSFYAPPPLVEQRYLQVFREENWPNAVLSAATDRDTPDGGRTGIRVPGPYDYVPPSYWLLDQSGGASGFAMEASPGAAIPVRETLGRMMPEGALWPMNENWSYHAGGGRFGNLSIFTNALEERYGRATGLDDYVRKSQAMAYEGERALFEAFRRNSASSATGVIHWLVNSGWPSLIWHLYDYYLRPGGGYFGAKKANEPAHVQYSYDDSTIVVVNSAARALSHYRATARVYDFDLTERYSRSEVVDVPAQGMVRAFALPPIDDLSRTYFVRLTLEGDGGAVVSSNFYWLSTQPDVLDWLASDGRHTPLSACADLKDLQKLPPVRLKLEWQSGQDGANRVDRVTVTNPSPYLAFGVRLTVRKASTGEDITPVFWSENYFELFPGETREVTAAYDGALLGGGVASIQAEGWNARGN